MSYFTLMCFGMIDNGRGPAYPFMLDSFGVSPSLGSLIFTLTSIAALITNATSKSWLSFLGARQSLQFSLFMQFIGSLIYGLASIKAESFTLIYLASILFGIGAGASNVCISIIIAKSTAEHNRRQFFSGLHSIYAVSSLITPLLFSFTLKFDGTWNNFFIYLSILPLFFFFLSFVLKFKVANEDQIKSMKVAQIPLTVRAQVGLMLALNVTAEVLISSRLVFFLKESAQFSTDKSSLYLSLFFFCLLLGRVIPAFFPIPLKSIYVLLTSALLSLVLTVAGLYLDPLFLSIAGGSMAFFFPTALDWISKRFINNSDYMMASALNYVGVVLILMHVSFGNIVNSLGINAAMHLSPIVLIISLFLIMKFILDRETNSLESLS